MLLIDDMACVLLHTGCIGLAGALGDRVHRSHGALGLFLCVYLTTLTLSNFNYLDSGYLEIIKAL